MPKQLRGERPEVKTLKGPNIACEIPSCENGASYLFRTGKGPISALCRYHAQESASRQGIDLPDQTAEKVLQAGW